jgi:phage tail protein X
MPERIVIQSEGMMLDLLLWRRYGRRGQTLVDEAYRLNRRLADVGVILPVGTIIFLPDLPPNPRAPQRRAVSLFD